MFRPPPLPRTLEAALRDAADPKPSVRVDALAELAPHAATDRARVVAALERALDDTHPPARAIALQVLGAVEAEEVLPAILVRCEDDDAAVRQEAIAALGAIRDERACGKLERALVDGRPEVRFQAVMAYPRVCRARGDVVEALVRATGDEDEHVAHIALRMAEELAGARAPLAGVDPEADPEELAVDDDAIDDDDATPADVPAPILERARTLLTHRSPRVRAVAAIVLARAGDPAGHGVLVGVVDGSVPTPEAEDVAAAIHLAGRLRLTGARRALERRAFGGLLGFGRDATAWHARTALARMDHERATREVLRDVESRDPGRRALAVVAAGQARLQAARPALTRIAGRSGAEATLASRALAALDRARSAGGTDDDDGGSR